MVKRKRGAGAKLQDKLEEQDVGIFRALKAAKGFERQRQSKRARASANAPEKKARIEKEISMLKVREQLYRVHLDLLAFGRMRASPETYTYPVC